MRSSLQCVSGKYFAAMAVQPAIGVKVLSPNNNITEVTLLFNVLQVQSTQRSQEHGECPKLQTQ